MNALKVHGPQLCNLAKQRHVIESFHDHYYGKRYFLVSNYNFKVEEYRNKLEGINKGKRVMCTKEITKYMEEISEVIEAKRILERRNHAT